MQTEVIAKAVLATATIGTISQIPPLYILALVGLVWGLLAYINEPKKDLKDAITFLISWALLAVTGTRYIIENFLTETAFAQELWIWIALVLGLLGHSFVRKILSKKKEIVSVVSGNLKNK